MHIAVQELNVVALIYEAAFERFADMRSADLQRNGGSGLGLST